MIKLELDNGELMRLITTSTRVRQRGAMTILISLIILTLITMITLYTAKTVSIEQKISGNDARSKMAFEAAEAGMEAAIAYAENGGFDHDDDDAVSDEFVFYASGLVATDASGTTNSKTFNNNSTVAITLAMDASTVSDSDNFYITSVGTSGDGVASRTVSTTIGTDDPLATAPNTPFTARGSLVVGGSATIHNPEGFGTIVTGGVATISGNNATVSTRVASKDSTNSDNNWPACSGGEFKCDDGTLYNGCPGTEYVKCVVVDAAAKTATMGDVIDGETTLSDYTPDEFFMATFGVSKAHFKNNVADIVISGADFADDYPDGANLATNKIIWVDGDTSGSPTVGCSASMGTRAKNSGPDYGAYDTPCKDVGTRGPSLVVIDGDFKTNGAVVLGLLYVIGDVDTAGNPEVHGAMIVEGTNTAVTGTLDIWYDSGILRDMEEALAENIATSGSWKDF